MLNALITLLFCQLLGELIARLASIPVPGPLVGMLILLAWIMSKGGPSAELEKFCRSLLSWLALLFVPAATGLINGLDQLASDWWRIALAILGSTIAGLASTAWVMHTLNRASSKSKESI